MEYRRLGSTGLRISRLGLGCGNFGGVGSRPDLYGMGESKDQAFELMDRAWDAGINFFDTADAYGGGRSETFIGEWLKARGSHVRNQLLLASKVFNAVGSGPNDRGLSRRHILTQIDSSLTRLQTDRLEMYLIHEPDPETLLEETLRALDDLVHAGKVRYIGCSNMAAWQVVEADWTARDRGLAAFASCQDEYSLVVRGLERELMPAMQAYGLGLLPYFPLASGLLTGKYKRNTTLPASTRLTTTQRLADRFMTDGNWEVVERLEGFCAERGHSLLELAFSWLVRRPAVSSVIAGATRPEQIEQNVRATGWALAADDLAAIDRITGVA
jgi:aryl-alcohol dehydrogenase-like predicted oxidoreductase